MRRGIYIGRFEPFHLGHLDVVREMSRASDLEKIIIGIGSSQYSNTLENPFTKEERAEMIRRAVHDAGITKPVDIVEIPDIHDYPRWLPYVQSTLGLDPNTDVVYNPGNTITQQLFRNAGFNVRTDIKTTDISGTRVRELMFTDGNWKQYLNKATADYLNEIDAVERLKRIAKDAGVKQIDLDDVVIVPRVSKYEWDREKFGLEHDSLMEKYRQEGADAEKIYQSHLRQKAALAELQKYFKAEQFIPRDKLTKDTVAQASAVISLGGDDHFKYVSHFVDNTLVVGINADPLTSEGALTNFIPEQIEDLILRLQKGAFSVEEWVRLQAVVDGKEIEPAISEYFLGASDRLLTSRNVLTYDGQREEQAGSGLLVVTGAGSTGWYNSACRYLHPNGNKVPKNEKFARWLVTEPYEGKLVSAQMLEGRLQPGQVLEVKSLNNNAGIISSDSINTYDFPRGSTAVIKISAHPLKVVKVQYDRVH